MIARFDYGIIQKDHEYSMIAEGYDWYLIRVRGQTIYTFKWIFVDDN